MFTVSYRSALFCNEHILNFWSVSSCFRVFPLYLICFICYETEMGLLKNISVLSFHFVWLCFVMRIEQVFMVCFICFRVFPIYLIGFICYETEIGL